MAKQQPTLEKVVRNQGYTIALLLILLIVLLVAFVNIQTLTEDVSSGAFTSKICSDSDALDYYTRGYVNYRNTKIYDSCASSSVVKEGYCYRNQYASTLYTCPYGCSNGACNTKYPDKTVCTSNDQCASNLCSRDLDLANSACCSNGTCWHNAGSQCLANGYVTNSLHNGAQGSGYYICINGVWIITSNATNATCTDSDGGINIYVSGACEQTSGAGGFGIADSCILSTQNASYSAVSECFCSNGKINTTIISCPSGYACSNGACVTTCIPSCTGTHTGCSVYINQTACTAHACAWQSYNVNGTTTYACAGTPHACSSLTTQSECQNNHGCTWKTC